MDELTDYLAAIDEKVEDVLRAQKDAVLSRMIGLGLVIEETLTIREHGGRVSDITWSKVQGRRRTIARDAGLRLRQLDALAEKLEAKRKIATWPRPLRWRRRRRRSGSPSWPAAGSCRTPSPSSSSTGARRAPRLGRAPPDACSARTRLALRQDHGRLLARLDAAAARAQHQGLRHPARARVLWCTRATWSAAVSSLLGARHRGSRELVEAPRWGRAAVTSGPALGGAR
jgi:hypothetical protein